MENNNFEKLEDDLLDCVAGGSISNSQGVLQVFCPNCNKKTEHREASGGRLFCKVCGTQH